MVMDPALMIGQKTLPQLDMATFGGSLMLQLAYGYKPRDPQDRFYTEVKLATRNIVEAAMQTNFLVNVFPVLSYIPDWFPGTGWKCIAREWKMQQERAKNEPYEWLKAHVASGTYQPSIVSSLLQDHKLLSGFSSLEQDKRLKEIGIVLFGAGTDTGTRATIRAIGRDVRHYENPEVFNPDRFMNPEVQRPPVFGWGRRKCPGVYFAEVSVFIIVASMLATFTFSKKRDAGGHEIVPQVELERNSLITELKPFEFELKLRSEDHMQLIIEANPDTE
ncbi:cytochrome P450 family protein [Rhizoctonia solani]|uniref:Cytochrome P450 family protein n=1 Tax=Rhizoctonia solani TaxID=456999 RepID=A0A8H8T2G1_9AGAM|nr:cytochrome P450 family protein [Rhizoctonia solani]QRW26304.1 cytochrome P450 family protein [Rhizoctonia solani]